MKLYDAIKEIVKLKGNNIITDSALLNYLNDYHAFEERPASKLILLGMKEVMDFHLFFQDEETQSSDNLDFPSLMTIKSYYQSDKDYAISVCVRKNHDN